MAERQDLEPLLSTQQNQLDIVLEQGYNIDNKALAILASNIALLIFIGQAELSLTWWQFIGLLAPFIVSLAFDCLAVWPRAYHSPVGDLRKHPEYLTMPRSQLILRLLANTNAAIMHNLQLNTLRWRFCVRSMMFTGFGAAILFAILVI